MSDPISDLIRQLGSGSPLIGAPRPNYGIVNTGDQSIDLVLSQLMMGMMGPGKFLPQQFPAQNLLDQMVSSKYASSTKAMTNRLRGDGFTAGTDNAAVFERLKGIRSRFDNTPLTPLGEAQLRNSAQYVNNDLTQALLSATMGPQAMEDLFFGQRGSKEMLGRSAATIGFYRPDAITGNGRMTEKSLETFTDQVYSNLYGPDADLNDISGFSAGRTGTIMQDLARRGLLPASVSKLTPEERRRSLKNNSADIGKLNLPSNITAALNDDKTFDEIAEMSGGADAIRKIDATRVSNSLKEYTKAISTVREIFGDNGMSDAPMGQLLAAMEALTQNSMGSMAPGKLENLMRRTQMAARDSGVSLEGLLGLTSRAGALADQNGLAREYAPDAVVSAMERTKALRDNGGFAPGFGRADVDKATLAMLDQNVRADASPVARLVSVAQRAIKENLLNPAVKGGDAQLKALVNAIGSGQTMMYDPATNKQIDIYKELGRNPDAFLKPMFDAAGITPELASSLYNSPGTAEYLREMQGRQFHLVQPGEIKARLAQQITASGRFGGAMSSDVSDGDREALNAELSQTFAKTAIDVVSTQMKPEERTAAYKDAIRNVFVRRAFSIGGVAPGDMVQATEYANNEMGRFFGGDEKLNQLVGARAGELDAHLNGLFPGLTLSNAQQYYSERATQDGAKLHRANMSRINLFDNLRGPGSNPYQRLSDYLVSGEGSAMDAILGTVDKGSVVDKIKGSMQAGDVEKFDATYKELIDAKNELYVDTPEERNKALKAAASGELSAVIDQFKGTAAYEELKGKTTYKTNAQVAQDIKTRIGADGKAATDAAELFASRISKNGEKFTASDEQLKSLAALENIHGALGLAITPETITESQLKTFLDTTRAFNISSDPTLRADMIKRDAAFDSYNRSLRDGNFKSQDILGMVGVSDSIASNEDINKTFAGFLENGEDAQAENLRYQLRAYGASEQQVEKIISAGRASYAFKREGGLDSINAANASEYNAMTSRSMAVLSALGDSDGKGRIIDANSEIAELAKLKAEGRLPEDKKQRYKEIYNDPKAYEEAVKAAALRSPEHGNSKTDTANAILEDAQKREKSLLPTDIGALAGGLGGGLASVGTGIATAIKEAFNGEVTIQTAKIEKLDIQLGDIAATIASTMLSAATPQARDGTMTGTMQIAGDLKTAIVNIIEAGRPALEFPPGVDGAPIHPTA